MKEIKAVLIPKLKVEDSVLESSTVIPIKIANQSSILIDPIQNTIEPKVLPQLIVSNLLSEFNLIDYKVKKIVNTADVPKQEPFNDALSSILAVNITIPSQCPESDSIIESNIVVNSNNPSAEEIINKFLGGNLSDVDFAKLMAEVIVRFNTEPKKYEKYDYKKLLQLILKVGVSLLTLISTLDVISENEDVLKVEKDGYKFTLKPQLAEEITEESNDNNDKKIANVSTIRNYINKQLTWKEF